MGLLKHGLLPFFAIVHGMSILACRTLDGWAEMVNLQLENPESDLQSKRQLHMLGCLKAFNIALTILCVKGIITESSHFRGIVTLIEAIVFGIVTIDAYQLDLDFYIPMAMAVVAAIGVVIHSQEPGIFTTDKKQETKTN